LTHHPTMQILLKLMNECLIDWLFAFDLFFFPSVHFSLSGTKYGTSHFTGRSCFHDLAFNELSGLYPYLALGCPEKFVRAPPKPFWRHDSLSGGNNHMHESTSERTDFPCDVHKSFKY
jgi:hypothetical protein